MNTAEDELKSILNKLPKELSVAFAIYCAKDCVQYARSEDKDLILTCISTTEDYMKGLCSLASLEQVKDKVYSAAYSAAYASHAASHAAYAYVASYASAKGEVKESKLKEYLDHLKTMINSLSQTEKLIYDLEIM